MFNSHSTGDISVKNFLEQIYLQYNKPEYIHPDPLEFIYQYKSPQDREIVGLIASSLAYGKVDLILSSVEKILAPMKESPCIFLTNVSDRDLLLLFKNFHYRFTDGLDIIFFLTAIRRVIKQFGSLEKLFLTAIKKHENIIEALTYFSSVISRGYRKKNFYLLPSPLNGSACKRMMLYLRWMIRKDRVDPGCWDGINPKLLIVPLDTHMYKLSQYMGFTKRKSIDIKTAIEITEKFKIYSPDDPVKYDFALTRFGIRNEMSYKDFIQLKNFII